MSSFKREGMVSTDFGFDSRASLQEMAIARQEGVASAAGVLTVTTGERTGRSPKDRYIVKREATAHAVDWGVVNQPVAPAVFEDLWQLTAEHLKDALTSVLWVGAHKDHEWRLQVTTEFVWHHIFAKNLFIEADDHEVDVSRQWQIFNAPTFVIDSERFATHSEAAVMIDLETRRILIMGMRYAGEMKKAVFSAMNYFLPEKDILPMHCAANQNDQGEVALFFGLSGTGKTTLSADDQRPIIGDDEHGWAADGVFNFEGGCYAKCYNLSLAKEPVIWQAIRPGAVMENVVLQDGVPDFSDTRLSGNSRVAYPRAFIDNKVDANRGGTPKHVLFLTCDLYGVLPAVSVLSLEQAAYYFLCGYTAKLGSTEVGSQSAIAPVFSACFGAPFFPRKVSVYAELLMKRLTESQARVYLVNTGWQGGSLDHGKRYDIDTTRQVVRAVCDGKVTDDLQTLPGFHLAFPRELDGLSTEVLDPRSSWQDETAYWQSANQLIEAFKAHSDTLTMTNEMRKACPVIV